MLTRAIALENEIEILILQKYIICLTVAFGTAKIQYIPIILPKFC